MQIDPYLSLQTKFKTLNIRPNTLNLIEEKVGNSREHVDSGENFLIRTHMAQDLRSTIDK